MLGCVSNLRRSAPHRPKILIFRAVQLVKAHAATGGLHLQIKRRGLAGLLLVASQARKAGGEGVGDAEVHSYTTHFLAIAASAIAIAVSALRTCAPSQVVRPILG